MAMAGNKITIIENPVKNRQNATMRAMGLQRRIFHVNRSFIHCQWHPIPDMICQIPKHQSK
jgi:hypothetical protein